MADADLTARIHAAVTERAPQAVLGIDPFHVVAWAMKALDKVRARTMTGAGIRDRHAMWATRKNPTDLTGLGITKSAESAHVNLIYSPLPKLEVGAELIWGKRELETGDAGELNRLQTHVKYSF